MRTSSAFMWSITTCYASWANAPLSRTMCHSPWRHFCWPRPRCSAPGASSCRRPCERPSTVCGSRLWSGIIVLFFALSPLKLEHYGLPALPALAILIAHYWRDCVQKGLKRSVWLFIPLSALILPSLLLTSRAIPLGSAVEAMFSTDVYSRMGQAQGGSYAIPLMDELIPLFQGGGVVLCLGVVATLLAAIRQSLRIALGCFAVMAIVLQGVISQVYELTAEFRSVAPLATRILERLHGDDLVVHEGPVKNSAGLTFYTGRQVHVVDGQRRDTHRGDPALHDRAGRCRRYRRPACRPHCLRGHGVDAVRKGRTGRARAVPGNFPPHQGGPRATHAPRSRAGDILRW
jgi:hypothetical protein